LEFNKDEYRELIDFAKTIGITMFATAFDIPSADLLESLDMPFYKIASACLTDIPLIRHIGTFKKPVIISTASVVFDDIDQALEALGHDKVALLHCVAKYQNTRPEDLMLRYIDELKHAYGLPVGYSSHYSGYWDGIRAIERYDIKIIEKHFTLRHEDKGTDHKFSLEPQGMKALTEYIKNRSAFDGTATRVRLNEEIAPLAKMGKSIHVIRPIKAGDRLTPDNIAVKSPDDGGLRPVYMDSIIGKCAVMNLSTSSTLTMEAIR
jgi:sialic acid synthase